MAPHLLLVEDEPAARWALEKGLREEGYAVTAVGDGAAALRLSETPFDAVVLDLRLPAVDGLDVCRTLRARGASAPVLMLTARDGVDDRIAGLDAGGDDYLVKPYDFGELLARVRALLRRGPLRRPPAITVGDLTLRPQTGEAECGPARAPLTPKEMAVLECLALHAGRIVSQQEILDHAWPGGEPDSNVVEVYVARVRRKIESIRSRAVLRTRRGLGYVLAAAPERP